MNRKKLHIGQNVQRIRIYLDVKQETLAESLGVSQQEVSKIEKQEEIEEYLLLNIADSLGVSPELIRNFNLERAINNVYNNNIETSISTNSTPDIDGSNIKMINKIIELYERILASEMEKTELLKRFIK